MPVTNTDSVLWYNVEVFGELGYGVPNPSDDVGSLNPQIIDLVQLLGRALFYIMHHEDVDLKIPPSINTLTRIHRLYLRTGQILQGRAVPPGVPNLESQHVQPAGDVFLVFPIPYFRVRNPMMKRWAGLAMMAISEAMQHTENRKSTEISLDFAGQIGQYVQRIYQNMAIELFGKTREEATADGFLLSDADLVAYNPSAYFTSTEMVDTVPNLGKVLTEDRLKVLSEGIPVTHLPNLQPWPTNLTTYYEQLRKGEPTASDIQLGEPGDIKQNSNASGVASFSFPVAPKP